MFITRTWKVIVARSDGAKVPSEIPDDGFVPA